MEMVLELQELDAPNELAYGGSNYGGESNLSLLAGCAASTLSLATCH
ncbi:SapB/AmfS family lanthipeptide [Saccharopolyspora phatthalungensis]|uniref:SapB/AmfS family lantipeptide n=1 Tax=Saccharopolyspora phatthalungensis TaxID=664693 RepID=A0A840QD38_9PSEU|nr:SapB/AmfS family lanthipeptide [Saccharopolyspora phatthalungensis]MBB5157700.1 hypothetical protein [Saccharopolyspora phatthalungensis]